MQPGGMPVAPLDVSNLVVLRAVCTFQYTAEHNLRSCGISMRSRVTAAIVVGDLNEISHDFNMAKSIALLFWPIHCADKDDTQTLPHLQAALNSERET